MRKIQRFQAKDGSEFKTEAECIAYEELCDEVSKVMKTLPPLPKDTGCNFANGNGYIQHDAGKLEIARVAILKIGQRSAKDPPWLQQTIDDPTIHPSWASRLISEACPSPVRDAWYRFQCIDKKNREWGQPYYANNPDEAGGQYEIVSSVRESIKS